MSHLFLFNFSFLIRHFCFQWLVQKKYSSIAGSAISFACRTPGSSVTTYSSVSGTSSSSTMAQGRCPYSRNGGESGSSADSASNPTSMEVTHPPARCRLLFPWRVASFVPEVPITLTPLHCPRRVLAPSRARPLSFSARRSPQLRYFARRVIAPSRKPPTSFPCDNIFP